MCRNQHFESFGWESDLCLKAFHFLNFFSSFFFSFSYLFAAVVDLPLGLLPVEKFIRKHHWDGQFLPWSSYVLLQEILLHIFHSNCWAFFSIIIFIINSIELITSIWESLERSFPPAELDYRWCQFWSNTISSEMEQMPMLVMTSYNPHSSQWVNEKPQIDLLSYHTISANRVQWLYVIHKMATLTCKFLLFLSARGTFWNKWVKFLTRLKKGLCQVQFIDFFFKKKLEIVETNWCIPVCANTITCKNLSFKWQFSPCDCEKFVLHSN